MKKLIILLFIICVIFSCSEYKKFTLYKLKPFDSTSIPLKINGIYVRENKDSSTVSNFDYLRLYDNGIIGTSYGGHYIIRKNELFGDWFNYEAGGSFKKFIETFSGKIINDSTIMIEKNYCNYCYKNFSEYRNSTGIIFNPPLILKLDTSIPKPDISKVWFLKKRWYKKNVWYNNQ